MDHERDDEDDLWTAAGRTNTASAGPRGLLPHVLDLALEHLSMGELQLLAEAVAFETRRRKLTQVQQGRGAATQVPATVSRGSDTAQEHGLTPAQVNLIRSSIKAGVKPAVLQRQFGISRAQITAVMKA